MSSIEKRRSDRTGAEVHRVRYRHDQKNQAVSFDTLEQAETWKALLDQVGHERARAALGVTDAATVRTVTQQVTHHIEHLTGVTSGTKSDYLNYLHRDITPTLGLVPITLLGRDQIADWVNALAGRGLSGKSIRNRHSLLSAALSSAQRDGLLPEHPSKGMRLPRTDHQRREMVFLTGAEWQTLLAALDPRWRALATTLVGTGMRFGEATALTISDVDAATRSARIRQAWKHTDGKGYELGPPKSKRSVRTVALPPEVVDLLEPLLTGRKGDGFVFTNTRGGPVRQNAFHGDAWTPAVRVLAGDLRVSQPRTPGQIGRSRIAWEPGPGKRPRIHDLRHTFASWAIQAGIPLPVIQRSLGHESITTTIDTYGHLARADFDALAQATSRALSPAAPPLPLAVE